MVFIAIITITLKKKGKWFKAGKIIVTITSAASQELWIGNLTRVSFKVVRCNCSGNEEGLKNISEARIETVKAKSRKRKDDLHLKFLEFTTCTEEVENT